MVLDDNIKICSMNNLHRYLPLSQDEDLPIKFTGNGGYLPVHLPKKRNFLIILCIYVPVQVCLLWLFKRNVENGRSGFLIDTKGCRIMDLEDFSMNLSRYFYEEDAIDCNPGRIPSLVRARPTTSELYVDTAAALNYTNGSFSCCYQPIRRLEYPKDVNIEMSNLNYPKNVDSTISIWYSQVCFNFNNSVVVEHEFLKAKCTEGEKEIYTEYFAFPKNPYKEGDREFKNAMNSDNLSVLVIGFYGMPRLNFLRQMPKTVEFLKNHEAISLLGYNKVGHNTFPNVLPVLTGHSENSLMEVCWPTKESVFDNCTFLWDMFKMRGYVTAMGEDSPTTSIFNYFKKGFRKKPVDFYTRPFALAAECKTKNCKVKSDNSCIGNKRVSQVFNNLIESFINHMKHQLTFAFFWTNSLSHDSLNLPRLGDVDFFNLLTAMESNGVLNRTMLILMSDHGIRWGRFRRTFHGFLEERLPFVNTILPGWFRKKYSSAVANLKTNSKRLTSPFDLHETLKDILDLSKISDEALELNTLKFTRTSLFQPISADRTCKDAGVPPEFCACHFSWPVPTNSSILREAAKSVVGHLHFLLRDYSQCSKLEISDIVEGRIQEVPENPVCSPSKSLPHSYRNYIVTFETTPGSGLFEATVRHDIIKSKFSVIGTVSRLSLYRDQSRCISDYTLKLYCFCINNSSV